MKRKVVTFEKVSCKVESYSVRGRERRKKKEERTREIEIEIERTEKE